jgi:mRNA-degrading endonuclease RelE of RelBE toxin-antitoxin system
VTEPYELDLAGPAVRAIREQLPASVAAAIVEFLTGGLRENPQRVGHKLHYDLEGLWSARRGAFRVIYEIDEDIRLVRVLRVDHRRNVYRPSR